MGQIRQRIKWLTRKHLWLRYFFLVPWRVMYASYAIISKNNISGSHPDSNDNLTECAARDFTNYKSWSGVTRFYGRVAEVGPGCVTGTSKLFIADGCSQVDRIDRFHYGDSEADAAIRHFCAPAEDFFRSNRGYDFIVSCAVMEHLYDPLRATRAMASALNPGGMMIHGVDCHDHGQFSDSLPDLSFLRIPPLLYRPLKLASGLNRVRLSAYTAVVDELGLEYRVLVSSLSGISSPIVPPLPFDDIPSDLFYKSKSKLDVMRPKLAHFFREMPDSDLLVSSFILVARSVADR